MSTSKEMGLKAHMRAHGIWIWIILALLVAIVFPQLGLGNYYTRVAVIIMVYAVLGLGLNFVTGLAGMISMGHAAFFAVGAYIGAILTKNYGWNFFAAAPMAAIGAGLCGLLLGLPTMRLSGAYLVMVTSGFAEVVKMVTINWRSVTNGALGIKNVPSPVIFGYELSIGNGGMYYLALVILLLCVFVFYAVKYSKMGRALRAISDDELAAVMMGVDTNYYKILAFVIGAMMAGLIGAFYIGMQNYVDPYTFSADMSTVILCVVLVGGRGSIGGMIISAAILMIFPEVLRFMADYRFVVYGAILIFMMRFKPDGMFGGRSSKPYKLPKGVNLSNVRGK